MPTQVSDKMMDPPRRLKLEQTQSTENSINPILCNAQIESLEVESTVSGFSSRATSIAEVPLLGTTFNSIILGCYSTILALGATALGNAGVFVYIPKYGLSQTIISTTFSLATLFSIYSSIFIGYYGDKVVSRFGRRKPVIFVCFMCMAASVLMAFQIPQSFTTSHAAVAAWFIMCNLIFGIFSTMHMFAFLAWFVESCANQRDYTWIYTFPVSIGGGIGGILALVASNFGWLTFVTYTYVLAGTAMMFAVVWFLPNVQVSKASKQPPLLASFRILMRNKEYRSLLFNRILFTTGYNIAGEFIGYAAYVCFPYIRTWKMYQSLYIYFAISGVVTYIVAAISINFLVARYEKIKLYLLSAQIFIVLIIIQVCIFVPGLVQGSGEVNFSDNEWAYLFWAWFVIVVILGVLFAGGMLIESLILRDLIRLDTFVTGMNREIMYQTAISVPSQIVSTFVSAVPLSIFTSTGFRPDPHPVNDDIRSMYHWNYGSHVQIVFYSSFCFGIAALLSYFIFYKFPVTKSVVEQVEIALKKRSDKSTNAENSRQQDDRVSFGSVNGEHANSKSGEDSKPRSAGNSQNRDQENAGDDDNNDGDLAVDLGASLADNEEEMLMMHFSSSEIRVLSKSENNLAGQNIALLAINRLHSIALWILCPLACGSLLAAVVVQINGETTYQVLTINLFCMATAFFLYEGLRVHPFRELFRMTGT